MIDCRVVAMLGVGHGGYDRSYIEGIVDLKIGGASAIEIHDCHDSSPPTWFESVLSGSDLDMASRDFRRPIRTSGVQESRQHGYIRGRYSCLTRGFPQRCKKRREGDEKSTANPISIPSQRMAPNREDVMIITARTGRKQQQL